MVRLNGEEDDMRVTYIYSESCLVVRLYCEGDDMRVTYI